MTKEERLQKFLDHYPKERWPELREKFEETKRINDEIKACRIRLPDEIKQGKSLREAIAEYGLCLSDIGELWIKLAINPDQLALDAIKREWTVMGPLMMRLHKPLRDEFKD